jgi:hypothetical protein
MCNAVALTVWERSRRLLQLLTDDHAGWHHGACLDVCLGLLAL